MFHKNTALKYKKKVSPIVLTLRALKQLRLFCLETFLHRKWYYGEDSVIVL